MRRVQLNNPTPFGKNDFCTANIDTCVALLMIIKIEEPINMLINRPTCFLVKMVFVKIMVVCKRVSKLFSNLASTEQ